MLLVESHSICSVVVAISLPTELTTYCDLGGETDDPDSYFIVQEVSYGLVDVSRVRRQEGAENDQNLTSAVAWSMTLAKYRLVFSWTRSPCVLNLQKSTTRHLQPVL